MTGYTQNGTFHEIDTDAVGNPEFDGDRIYTWKHGRQIDTLTCDGITWTYEYNADGLRTARTSDTKDYFYVYNGTQLTQITIVTKGNNPSATVIDLSYDASGTPLTLTIDGTTYYYLTNIQGDIMGVIDESGVRHVSYFYDGYGISYYLANTDDGEMIAAIDPLGYRGYLLDGNTGLYYLQSRSYDPMKGRFINADAFVSTGQGILGNNMFAYCGNNPVTRVDSSGYGWTIVVSIVVNAGISVATSWIASVVTDQKFTWRDGIFAAVSGGVSAVSLPIGSLISGLYSAYTAYENGASLLGIIGSGLASGFCNMLSFGGLSQTGDELLDIAIDGFADLVFGTGYNSISTAVSKVLVDKTQRNTTTPKSKSAIDTIQQLQRISSTRVYNGQLITIGTKNCSYPGYLYDTTPKIYCHVKI